MLLSTFKINQKNIKEWTILDSGASSQFLCLDAPVTNKQTEKHPITVLSPNSDTMKSIYEGDFDLPQISKTARRCHILPTIKHSRIYVVKSCKTGYEVKFIKREVEIEVRCRGCLVLQEP